MLDVPGTDGDGRRQQSDVPMISPFDRSDCFTPRLTEMAQDCDEIGRKATPMLKRRDSVAGL
jgi:DNA-binding LacI/PurR family transcriptional regulator